MTGIKMVHKNYPGGAGAEFLFRNFQPEADAPPAHNNLIFPPEK